MKYLSLKRIFAFLLSFCMLFSFCGIQGFVFAASVGDTVTKNFASLLGTDELTANEPEDVEGAVWELTDYSWCGLLEHTHSESCWYKNCSHANGHTTDCYGETTEYELCSHSDDSEHSGTVTVSDVVTRSGFNFSWDESHPAYSVVKSEYDKLTGANRLKIFSYKFCYTVSEGTEPDLCEHPLCSELGGECYLKICLYSTEHSHAEDCYKYTWTLKADVNKNGVADEDDEMFTVSYVNEDGSLLAEYSVLTGLATPEYDGVAPQKAADAQYTYTFSGWETDIAEVVTEDVTYKAKYDTTVNKYTVVWQDEDGTVLETDNEVEYGAFPVFNGDEPSKEDTAETNYTFAGWTPVLSAVTGDVAYTVVFTEKNVYTVSFNYGVNGVVKTEYVIEGNVVAAPEYGRNYYYISNWYTDSEYETVYDFSAGVNGNLELFAKWTPFNDINYDNIADEEQLNSVSIVAENASVTVNGEASSEIEVAVNSKVTVTVTPNEGYFVENITVGETVLDITYSAQSAVVSFETDASKNYDVFVDVEKTALALKSSAEINKFSELNEKTVFNALYNADESNPVLSEDNVTVEYLALTVSITIPVVGTEYTYDYWATPGEDVSVEKFINNLGISGTVVNYIISAIGDNVPHAFGEQDVETVKLSYAGNDKYAPLEAIGEVKIIDGRIETVINVSEATLCYSEELTKEDIYNAVFVTLVADDEILDAVYGENMSIDIDSLNAGTHTVSVNYVGNDKYKNSSASVEVTIEKAESYTDIESVISKYGTDVNISSVIDTGFANRVEVVVGFALGDDASQNAGTVAYVNMPELIDVDAIENATVKAYVESVLDDLTSGNSMTVAEFKNTLEYVYNVLEGIENSGVDPAFGIEINSESIASAISVLEQIENLEYINELTVCISMGGAIIVSDAGVYLTAAVVTDENYNSSIGASYVVITPDGYKAELDWIISDENGLVTYNALQEGYTLDAYVTSVNEGSSAEAEKYLNNVFFGFDTDGNIIITEEQSELVLGAYTEVAFIFDIGNTMYYARPIVRAFAVVPELVDIIFVDENGNENNDRIFTYDGTSHPMSAVAYDEEGKELTSVDINYKYFGFMANGEYYYSSDAPVNSGVYSVVALYANDDNTLVGISVGSLAIKPAKADFSTEDVWVNYDGNPHFIKLNNPLGFEYISVITDEYGNINIVFPENWNVDSLDMKGKFDDVSEKLEKIENAIPEEVKNYYSSTFEELNAAIYEVFEGIDIVTVSINAELPVEVGKYKINVIAFGESNYAVAVSESVLEIHAHEYVEFITIVPTCCSFGEITNICCVCGDVYTQEIETDSENHTDTASVIKNSKDETCGADGYTGDTYWSCCDTLAEQGSTIPATGEHNYATEVEGTRVPATCKTAGSVTMKCECGATDVQTLELDAANHEKVATDAAVAATCTSTGRTEGSHCAACDTVIVAQTKTEKDASNHTGTATVIKNAVTVSCGADGYTGDTYWSCCDTLYASGETIPATGKHNYKATITVQASCKVDGEKTYICAVCEDTYIENLGLNTENHKGETEVRDAAAENCGTDGYSGDAYCLACGEKIVTGKVIPASGHSFDKDFCVNCNAVKVTEEYKLGDLNKDGKINAADARLALRLSVKLETLEGLDIPFEVADVDFDGNIKASDARTLLRVAVALETLNNKIVTVEYIVTDSKKK